MSFASNLMTWAIQTFAPEFTAPVDKAIEIERKFVEAGLVAKANAILKSEGIDIAGFFASGLNLRNVDDLTVALNKLVLEPA